MQKDTVLLNGVYSRVARFPFCQQNPPNCFSKLAKMYFFWWRPPGNICIPGDRCHVIWVVSTCGHEKQPMETVGKPWTWQLWSTGIMDCFYDTSVVRSFWCLFVQDGLFLCSAEQRNELGLDRVVILNPRLWWTLTSLDDLNSLCFPLSFLPAADHNYGTQLRGSDVRRHSAERGWWRCRRGHMYSDWGRVV